MKDILLDRGSAGSAASQVSGIAGRLRDIDIASSMEPIPGALPGSKTGEATIWLSTRLAAAVQVYADGLDGLDEGIRRSVDVIDETDKGVASNSKRYMV